MSTTTPVAPIPPGMAGFIPHLCCDGAAEAIAFYAKAFGAVELARLPGPDGRLMHAMLDIGGHKLMLNDEFPEYGGTSPQRLNGSPVTIHRFVADVDADFDRAVAAGCSVRMPLADMFWGDRYGILVCPWGHHWSLATHQRDLTPEQIAAGMRAGG